ncbi:MAG: prolipoprotein diacylglyceryl transferase [bacterium]
MYRILIDFGSLQLDPLWIVMVIVSLLLVAMAQSYASATKMRLMPATILSIVLLLIGNAIVYYVFIANFRERYPSNYTFPHVSIYSYGFMLMISFVIGTIWLISNGKREKPKIETDTILDLMVFIIIGSIIGARIVYVLTQWKDYQGDKANILRITEGGLSIHGGIIGALLFGWIYVKAKGLQYWRMVDFTIPAVALGMFFGRIGCFLNGCCYGIKCGDDFPLRVKFPNVDYWKDHKMPADLAQLYDAGSAAMGNFFRHPAQLYEAVGALAIFFYLINFRKHKAFNGHVFLMFVWLYSLLRFFVEFYRFGDPADNAKGSSIVLWHFITMAQFASIILGIVALVLMQDLKRRVAISRILMDTKATPEDKEAKEEESETVFVSDYGEEEPEEEEEEEPEAGEGSHEEPLIDVDENNKDETGQ